MVRKNASPLREVIIDKLCEQGEFNMSELAAELKVSRERVRQLTTEVLGMSPKKFFKTENKTKQVRLCHHCGALLANTNVYCSDMCSLVDHMRAADGDCLEFTGTVNAATGYGHLHSRDLGKTLAAHRRMYELTYGGIPEGLVVRHSCDNPRCCNPAHLLLGTHQQNSDDCVRRGRKLARVDWTEQEIEHIRETYQCTRDAEKLSQEYSARKGRRIHAMSIYHIAKGRTYAIAQEERVDNAL